VKVESLLFMLFSKFHKVKWSYEKMNCLWDQCYKNCVEPSNWSCQSCISTVPLILIPPSSNIIHKTTTKIRIITYDNMHGNQQPSRSYLHKAFPLISYQQQNSRFKTKLFIHFQYKNDFLKENNTRQQMYN